MASVDSTLLTGNLHQDLTRTWGSGKCSGMLLQCQVLDESTKLNDGREIKGEASSRVSGEERIGPRLPWLVTGNFYWVYFFFVIFLTFCDLDLCFAMVGYAPMCPRTDVPKDWCAKPNPIKTLT